MAGGKQLNATINVFGKGDKSLTALGNQLQSLGALLNPLSQRLLEFGKESVQAFASYEDAMLDAQVALKTQYNSAGELSRVMEELDKSALQWANDSRFTTEDVAGAISNAAHAGWDLEKILTGVPTAMQLSLAGGMELSRGLEYMVDITNASGISFRELGDMTDYWAYAANSSSTTIPEMGEAMQKMGATMQFVKGDMAGLTTMLAVLADNGAKGTEAGTLLRNTMLRLIAPTKAAAEAMGDMSLTAEELEEIYTDSEGLENAVKFLEGAGFSAYDAEGNLKSFLNVFEELNAVTKDMTEQERYNLLSSIFPTRTITGALALLDAANEKWNGLDESIRENGPGYAEYAAETMEGGLGGTLRHLNSVYNALQTNVGKTLSGPVEAGAEMLSGMLDAANNMNPKAFTALVDGLGALAAAGPALTGIGIGMRLLPVLGTVLSSPVGIAAMAAIAGTALATFVGQMNELDYQESLGDMAFDPAKVNGWLNAVDKGFRETTEDITTYAEAAEAAVEGYTQASRTLQESAAEAMVSGKKLSKEDRQGFYSLGETMRQEMLKGIAANRNESLSTADFFGDGSDIWANITDTMEYGFQSAIGKAETLSRQLRDAMTSAFSDGQLSAEEIIDIQGIVDQQNELIAMQADAKNAAERARLLHDAQTLGTEGIGKLSEQVGSSRTAALATLDDAYWQAYQNLYMGGQAKIKNGARNADGTLYTQENLDAEIAQAEAKWQERRTQTSAEYDKLLLNAIMAAGGSSDFAGAFAALAAGDGTAFLQQKYGSKRNAERFIKEAVESLGGIESLWAQAAAMTEAGDASAADFTQLAEMYNMSYVISLLGSEEAEKLYGAASIEVETNAAEAGAEIDAVAAQSRTAYIDIVTRGGSAWGGYGGGIDPMGLFAEGGRAEEASIFGEAGPEWAIPERHTPDTARLLSEAAAASGFTWPELAAMSGRTSGGNTLVYSPTIVANDANGVEGKLMDDKKRLEKYLKEKKFLDRVEVYQ